MNIMVILIKRKKDSKERNTLKLKEKKKNSLGRLKS